MRKLLISAVLLALISGGCGFPTYGPWQGKVVDSETKLPIEGAAVVAVWEKGFTMYPVGAGTSYHAAEETLTNINGEFHFMARRYFVSLLYGIVGPKLTIFKPGYGSFPEYQVSPKLLPIDLFEHMGTTVELPRLKTKEERLNKPTSVPTYVPPAKVRNLIRLLNIERRETGMTTFFKEPSK